MKTPRVTSHLPQHQSLYIQHLDVNQIPHHETIAHPHTTITLCIKGRGKIWCGANYNIEGGDLLIFPEGMPHYMVELVEPMEAISMFICQSCFAQTQPDLFHHCAQIAQGMSAKRTLDEDARQQCRWILHSIDRELQHNTPHQSKALEHYLGLLGIVLERSHLPMEHVEGSTLSARALDYIVHHAHKGISLADVAQHIHRSKAHTAALIKAETGKTTVEWITHTRLALARQLLLQTDETIETIAASVGFESPSHFHRTFKRHLNTTPSQWRREHST